MTRKQTPLETLARDVNWRRGRIAAFKVNGLKLIDEVAPDSLASRQSIIGLTQALNAHLREYEVSARKRLGTRQQCGGPNDRGYYHQLDRSVT